MTTSAVPLVIDALVTKSTAAFAELDAPQCLVLDGYDGTASTGNYLMVGVTDPESEWGMAATSQQDWATTGYDAERQERGDVTCAALAWDGGPTMKGVRDAAYAITAVVEDLCRANPTLDVPQLEWASFGTTTRYQQRVGAYGAISALVVFQVHFEARLTYEPTA